MFSLILKLLKIVVSFIYIIFRIFPFPLRILLYASLIVTIYLLFDTR